MRASLEKRWDVAGEIRDRVAAMFPLDKEAIFLAGDIRYHSDAYAEAMPYFRRALQLDPGYRLAADHLEWSLDQPRKSRRGGRLAAGAGPAGPVG